MRLQAAQENDAVASRRQSAQGGGGRRRGRRARFPITAGVSRGERGEEGGCEPCVLCGGPSRVHRRAQHRQPARLSTAAAAALDRRRRRLVRRMIILIFKVPTPLPHA